MRYKRPVAWYTLPPPWVQTIPEHRTAHARRDPREVGPARAQVSSTISPSIYVYTLLNFDIIYSEMAVGTRRRRRRRNGATVAHHTRCTQPSIATTGNVKHAARSWRGRSAHTSVSIHIRVASSVKSASSASLSTLWAVGQSWWVCACAL